MHFYWHAPYRQCTTEKQESKLKKRPATAELLSWLTVLHGMNATLQNPKKENRKKLEKSYAALAKNRDDLESMKRHVIQLFNQ